MHIPSTSWPPSERILVCIAPISVNERLVRSGHKLANDLSAEWFAIYIETPQHASLPESEREQINHVLQLADELGAQSLILPGLHVAETILQFARAHNVTKIITGKRIYSGWQRLLHRSISDRILRLSGEIDVYVISDRSPEMHLMRAPFLPGPSSRFGAYALSLALVALVTLAGLPFRDRLSPVDLVMLFLLSVVITAARLGRGPAVLATIASVMAFDFFFVPPQFTFAVYDADYLFTFAGLMAAGLVISALTAQLTQAATTANQRALQATASYELSQALAASSSLQDITEALVTHTSQTFGCAAAVFLSSLPLDQPTACSADYQPATTEADLDAIRLAINNGQTVQANGLYFPLKTPQETVGALSVRLGQERSLNPEQRRLLESFSSQSALAVERIGLVEKARQARLTRETEALQTALLNSISHDLRTPLASISGAISSLRDPDLYIDDTTREDLLENAWEEAGRLNRLVGNLLDMTRLESGTMHVVRVPCDFEEILEVALHALDERLGSRQVNLQPEENLPLIPADFTLLSQVMINLLDNALKYSPADTPIDVFAARRGEEVEILVADRGIGIPPADLERVFDKFFRVQRRDGVTGTGLGLAICRGIIEAHAGRIWAEARPQGGTEMHICLPLAVDELQSIKPV